MVPNAQDSAVTVAGKSVNAAAVGYIYLDDGVSILDPSRIDFYLSVDTAIPTITFSLTKHGSRLQSGVYTQIGKIRILFVSGVPQLAGIKSANIVTNAKTFTAVVNSVDFDAYEFDLLDTTTGHDATFYSIERVELLTQ